MHTHQSGRCREFLLVLLLVIPPCCCCLPEPDHRWCSDSGNYAGEFRKNLEQVLHSLAITTPITGFGTSASCTGANQALGLAMCRGDATSEDCLRCVANAAHVQSNSAPGAPQPNSGTPTVIRCSNSWWFNTVDDGHAFIKCTPWKASHPESLKRRLDLLASNVSVTAAAAPTMFAIGDINAYDSFTINGYNKIYALVQCTLDLSPDNCLRCLDHLNHRLLSSCGDYQGGRSGSGACMLVYDTEPFSGVPRRALDPSLSLVRTTQQLQASPSIPQPRHSGGESRNERDHKILVIVLSTILPLAFAYCIVAAVLYLTQKRRNTKNPKGKERNINLSAVQSNPENLNSGDANRKCHTEKLRPREGSDREYCNSFPVQIGDVEFCFYNLETIMAATNDFSEINKIGEGGNGIVYKGKLGGKEVAVKKLLMGNERTEEFLNEVKVVGKLHHRNLAQLLGCCAEKNEKLLVYEYVPNSSLDKFIFDPNRRVLLDWPSRSRIITGVARGLLYLHEECHLAIIHRDLKASNILLEMDTTPKIADFGLARTFEEGQTHANTMKMGYMASEFFLRGHVSPKYDVFSFAVLLLETVSGVSNQPGKRNLLEYAWTLWRDERPLQLVDTAVSYSCTASEVLRYIHVGLLCVQDKPEDRPPMFSVLRMLTGTAMELLPSPSPSTLLMGGTQVAG